MSSIIVLIALILNSLKVFVGCDVEIGNYSELNPKNCGLTRLSSGSDSFCFEWHKNTPLSPLINSRNVTFGETPWMALLVSHETVEEEGKIKKYHIICGGALIANQWILTSGHCLLIEGQIDVHFGYDLLVSDKESIKSEYKSIEKVIHPEYNFNKHNQTALYDIGLIKLNKPVDISSDGMSAKVNNICLPQKMQNIAEGMKEYAMIAGWGETNRLGIGYLKITYDSNEYSDELFKPLVLTKKLNDMRLCEGDSGSPIWQFYMGRAFVVGVFSSSAYQKDTFCQPENYRNTKEVPGITVWVPTNIDWIINVTRLK